MAGTRKADGTRAWLVICVLNLLALGAWSGQWYYLRSHRPAAPDPAHGFVLRQHGEHDDRVYYISHDDQVLSNGLLGLDVAVYAATGIYALLWIRARKRRA